VIIEPLDPPLASVYPVLEDLGWLNVGLVHGIIIRVSRPWATLCNAMLLTCMGASDDSWEPIAPVGGSLTPWVPLLQGSSP
jgi:hypothetical protein